MRMSRDVPEGFVDFRGYRTWYRAVGSGGTPLASVDEWAAEQKLLRDALPQEVRDVLDRHEQAGTYDDPEYEEAMEVYFDRHFYRGPKPRAEIERWRADRADARAGDRRRAGSRARGELPYPGARGDRPLPRRRRTIRARGRGEVAAHGRRRGAPHRRGATQPRGDRKVP